ncbi:hypothetical protein FB451DRAFT_983137, partial [Mycena latifolia]
PGSVTVENAKCILTVHPRVGLKNCPYTHIMEGRIRPATIQQRTCKTEMLIFIPIDGEYSHKALVVIRTPHNHPAHPKTKPGALDRMQLEKAVHSAGLTDLTVQKLLNAPSTSIVYSGQRVAESSPAFMDSRKVRDFISQAKKQQHPHGMGWDGRVDGELDEWEVAGFLDRFKHSEINHTSWPFLTALYCDIKTKEAFAQLFTELFDTIREVTGQFLKLAPFFPDAKCRVVIMDGEVPQAQGFAELLKTHINELPMHIPRPVIMRLKSIMGLSTHEEIDAWHEFCAVQTDPDIKNWYSHKLANAWILPSVNRLLSSISNDDWDITPLHSNYVETAHSGRNAETSIGVGLLTAILQAQERDNKRAEEIAQVERDVMRHRWNGAGEREKLSAQQKLWKIRKVSVRDNQLTTFDTLKAERDAGSEENKHSLERQKILEQQIKSIQAEQQLDRHRTDLRVAVNELRADIEAEKAGRREWAIRRGEIDEELEGLRKGPLAGARIKGRRP